MKSRFSTTLKLSAAAAVIMTALAASPVLAQAKPAAAGEGDVIIVTGSRIAQPNLSSAAPVTVVSAQSIKTTGTTRVEDLLNSLPQVFAGQASTISNGSDGTATVDLRGLGCARTLVLVDGRRLPPGGPGTSCADLNFVPVTLVKRVDVETGGASSTYGADAVAGVVNFIMDRNYTGFKLDGLYSLYQHNNNNTIVPPLDNARTATGLSGYGYPVGNTVDGGTVDVTATMGTGFDDGRGHIVVYGGYRKTNAVTQNNRDYSSCTIQNSSKKAIRCGGSATAYSNILDGTSNSYHVASGQTFAPGLTRYNYAPTNYFQRPDERYNAGFFGHYDINDAIQPYMDFMFMDDRTVAQIAPSGDFGNTNSINCDNPLLSAQQLSVVCTTNNLINGYISGSPQTGYQVLSGANTVPFTDPKTGTVYSGAPLNFFDPLTGKTYNQGKMTLLFRNVQGGPRQDDREHVDYRGVIGSKGTLGKAWSYDASYQYSRVLLNETYLNDVSISRLTKALDVIQAPNGTIECRSVETGIDPNCVPFNAFTTGGITQAATNYISSPGFQRSVNTEQVASVNFTGKLGEYGIKSPAARNGVVINIGGEYRLESEDFRVDQEFATGDLAGQGGATLPEKGSFNVTEGFGEISVPLVQDSFFKELTFSGAYRHSDYKLSTGGKFSTETWKLALNFAPVKDIMIRGNINRAVRAPNISELFSTQHVQLDGSTDPCAGLVDVNGLVNGNTQAQCAATGVTAAQFGKITANPAAQYNGFQGGNPNLTPEVAYTKTLGVVLQPRFIPRLAVTVDWYDIKVTNDISSYGADVILNNCVASGSPTFCSLIKRDGTGSLWLTPGGFVIDTNVNVGSVEEKGVDVNASYSTKLSHLGTLSVNFIGTALGSLKTTPGLPGVAAYDCAGYYGASCGTPNPKWRHSATATLATPNGITATLRWRYFGPVSVDYTNPSTTLSSTGIGTAGTPGALGDKISAQNYFDLSFAARVGNHMTWRLGANNLLDKSPPLVSTGGGGTGSQCAGTYCNGNTYPAVYDALGRYIYTSATLEF